MIRVCVFTGTRAEYGLLYWLMKDLQADPDICLQTLVSGMHLSPEFGYTYSQIENDGFEVNEKVEILLSSDSPVGVAKSVGLGLIGYADALQRLKPDVLVVLGDRFEALAIAEASMIMNLPILHLHGGEITEGAQDDSFRHAITKLSHLHCTSTEEYRQRVIQLGEQPDKVVCVGALGLEHLKRTQLMTVSELTESLDFNLDGDYLLVTYHPVTSADEDPVETFNALVDALNAFQDYKVIITYPNADEGGRRIIPLIEEYAQSDSERILSIQSLGYRRYLSTVKNASLVIGNSSSGIIEVPSFNVPTINIGVRQKGRVAADSVIDCGCDAGAIQQAMRQGLSQDFEKKGEKLANPYDQGIASEKIIKFLKSSSLDVTKQFYDLPGLD